MAEPARKPDLSINARRSDGDATRARLLDFAFSEIYAHGYQGLRVDTLLEKSGLTKGAFYHHFSSKQALGLAVIDELLAGLADLVWGQHLAQYDDPLEGIAASLDFAVGLLGERCTTLGCPINNLAQEMSAIDEEFRARLGEVFGGIISNIAAALGRGQENGVVRPDVDGRAAAVFILASFEGMIGLAKSMRDESLRLLALEEARRYLDSLRP